MSRAPLALCLATLLGACVGPPPPPAISYVAGLTPHDGPGVAITISNFVASTSRPGPIHIVPPVQDATVLPMLQGDLRRAGYTMSAGPGVHELRYDVEPFEGGILVHIDLDGTDAAGMFRRGDYGLLDATAPFMVRGSAG